MSDPLRRWAFPSRAPCSIPAHAVSRSRENPLLPLERELLSCLFHCRFKAEDGLQAVQSGVGVGCEGLQWGPLYEPPASASNGRPQRRRALQLERGERAPFVGESQESEHPIIVR